MEQSTFSFSKAKTIARAIIEFAGQVKGKPDFEAMVRHVNKQVAAEKLDIAEVLEFMQEVGSLETTRTEIALDIETGPVNLADETSYAYGTAKALLKRELERTAPDSEELRKNLREMSRIVDSLIRAQERVYNLQSMQRFVVKVLEILGEDETKARELLEADI